MISTRTYTEHNENMLAALESRDQTLASIVHELSNPLTTILGLSQLMLEEDQSPDSRLARIRGEAERSVRIIRNILDLCKSEETVVDMRVPVDLNEAIRHGAALVEDQLERHRIVLTVEL